MGQQSSGVSRIHELSRSLILVRSQPGEKTFINRATSQEYLLLTRLAQGQDALEATLPKRAELTGQFVPALVEYGRETQGYCSDTAVLHMLFRQPSRSLREEQIHRMEAEEGFEEGELLMVAYCTLMALQDFARLGQGYEVLVSEETLLIEIQGRIVLTDAPRYREQPGRHSLRRICNQHGRVASRIAMGQLAGVLSRMIAEDITGQPYSECLKTFVELLRNAGFQTYQEALTHLQFLKKTDRSSSTKPKSTASLNETPTNPITPCTSSTPIGQLIPLLDHNQKIPPKEPPRQPLRDIPHNANQPIKSFCYGKRKESKLQIYKSKFQARKAEAFAEQPLLENALPLPHQDSTIRLDEISSIQQRNTLRETEQDQHDSPSSENILPQGLLCYESQQIPHHNPVPPVTLFSCNRPERLKQLVLNQKGIIYQESADELSSLASQRTHRVRNFSFHE